MLNNLITTCLLTMGVANVTPICDKQAPLTALNETVETQYTLTLNKQGENNQVYTGQRVSSNQSPLPTGQVNEKVANYQNNNLALNVIGTEYKSNCLTNQSPIRQYIMNREYYNVDQNIYDHSTRSTFVLQIDSYNYNKNTAIDTEVSITIEDTTVGNETVHIQQKYYVRTVYTTVQDDWSIYLQRQNTVFGGNTILEEVENPNSNFYYTKKVDVIQALLTDNIDTFNISLVPNTKNYIIIDYVPMGLFIDEYLGSYDVIGANIPTVPIDYYESGFNVSNITFTGTNIIPEGTYEVIDLPGLMWEIVTMPFAFVSQAFNLTLFPGTPYQLNISNLFLSIIAIFVFVWLISLFLKMKG